MLGHIKSTRVHTWQRTLTSSIHIAFRSPNKGVDHITHLQSTSCLRLISLTLPPHPVTIKASFVGRPANWFDSIWKSSVPRYCSLFAINITTSNKSTKNSGTAEQVKRMDEERVAGIFHNTSVELPPSSVAPLLSNGGFRKNKMTTTTVTREADSTPRKFVKVSRINAIYPWDSSRGLMHYTGNCCCCLSVGLGLC